MRRKRVMIIGPTNCGKTTLANVLNGFVGPTRKTQDMIYGINTIDVPGSYIENTWMYKHLIAAAQDASHVVIMVDQSRPSSVYSPGFAKVFRCPVVGVISKIDIMPENEVLCIRQLRLAGLDEPFFRISTKNGVGIDALKNCLFRE